MNHLPTDIQLAFVKEILHSDLTTNEIINLTKAVTSNNLTYNTIYTTARACELATRIYNVNKKYTPKPEFQPFTLTIEVSTQAELEALWLLANNLSGLRNYLNEECKAQKKAYCETERFPINIGNMFSHSKLEKERVKYTDKDGNYNLD